MWASTEVSEHEKELRGRPLIPFEEYKEESVKKINQWG